jgi:transketolase
MKGGRKAFLQTLTKLAEKDPKVIFIIGDVGFSFIEEYKSRFPNQFLNTGACEQTMMNIAVGLANVGWRPYVYTMINFIVFRPYEQVRNNICYSNKNVKLFGVEGSESYKFLGYSHNIYEDEDKKLLDHLPNIHTYYPKTEEEIVTSMLKEYETNAPCYWRI